MRLFQNYGLARSFKRIADKNLEHLSCFADQIDWVLDSRYGSSHLLKPIVDRQESAFFAIGDNEIIQRRWAIENGLPKGTSLEDILLAQIEHHNADVFYNLDPLRYDDRFVKRMPGCVKKVLGWRAAPGSTTFQNYDYILSNFPTILAGYKAMGINTAEFYPSHDPVLDDYAINENRPIDILFYGGYSRFHQSRAKILEAVAKLEQDYKVDFHFDVSRTTKLSETPLGWFGLLRKHQRPRAIQDVTRPPIFARDVYKQISQAKIVLNAAIDIGGMDRGNMRCFEAMGGGALLLTDEGNYPAGMSNGETMITYSSSENAADQVKNILSQPESYLAIAEAGYEMVKARYSKKSQYQRFLHLL